LATVALEERTLCSPIFFAAEKD
jgi:hypothetical protein